MSQDEHLKTEACKITFENLGRCVILHRQTSYNMYYEEKPCQQGPSALILKLEYKNSLSFHSSFGTENAMHVPQHFDFEIQLRGQMAVTCVSSASS